jgi:hypothetical protein
VASVVLPDSPRLHNSASEVPHITGHRPLFRNQDEWEKKVNFLRLFGLEISQEIIDAEPNRQQEVPADASPTAQPAVGPTPVDASPTEGPLEDEHLVGMDPRERGLQRLRDARAKRTDRPSYIGDALKYAQKELFDRPTALTLTTLTRPWDLPAPSALRAGEIPLPKWAPVESPETRRAEAEMMERFRDTPFPIQLAVDPLNWAIVPGLVKTAARLGAKAIIPAARKALPSGSSAPKEAAERPLLALPSPEGPTRTFIGEGPTPIFPKSEQMVIVTEGMPEGLRVALNPNRISRRFRTEGFANTDFHQSARLLPVDASADDIANELADLRLTRADPSLPGTRVAPPLVAGTIRRFESLANLKRVPKRLQDQPPGSLYEILRRDPLHPTRHQDLARRYRGPSLSDLQEGNLVPALKPSNIQGTEVVSKSPPFMTFTSGTRVQERVRRLDPYFGPIQRRVRTPDQPPLTLSEPPPGLKKEAIEEGAFLPELPGIEDAMSSDFLPNFTRNIAEKLGNIPIARNVLRMGNESALVNDPLHQGMISYQRLLDSGTNASIAATSQLRKLGKVWKVAPDGRVLNVRIPEGASPYIGDVLSSPEKYDLNAAQREWTRIAFSLLEQRFDRLRRKGIDIKELKFDNPERLISMDIDASSHYFPRITSGIKRSVGQRLRGRPSQTKMRIFPTQKEGVESGIQYIPDPNDIMEMTLQSAYRLEAESSLKNYLRPFARRQGPGVDAPLKTEAAYAEGTFDISGKRFIFSAEEAQLLASRMNARGMPLLKPFATGTDVIRFLGTGFDWGFAFIHGQIMAATNPVRWARSNALAARSLLNPASHHAYLEKNMDTVKHMIDTGSAPLSSSEHVAGATPLSGIPVVGKVTEAAARAFNTFLDVGRIEFHKALDHLATTPAEARRLSNTIDHMMGISSPAQLGISPTQRQMEGIFLMFAPRYQRAFVALLNDIASGGPASKEAASRLTALSAGATAAMTLLALKLDPDRVESGELYNPTSNKFMSVPIGKEEFGVPGVFQSNVRTIGRIFQGFKVGAEEGVGGSLRGGGKAVITSLRYRTSPGTGQIADIIDGKNAIGEEINFLNARSLGIHIAEGTLPFYIEPYISEGLLDESKEMPSLLRGSAGVIGLRERPQSAYQQRDRAWRDYLRATPTHAHAGRAKERVDVPPNVRRELIQGNSELKRLEELVKTQRQARGGKFADFERETDNVTSVFHDTLEQAAKDFESKKMSFSDYKGISYKAQQEWRASKRALRGSIMFKGLFDGLDPRTDEEAVLDAYYEKKDELEASITRSLTNRDHRLIKRQLDSWLKRTYPANLASYVRDSFNAWIEDLPPTAKKLEREIQRRKR